MYDSVDLENLVCMTAKWRSEQDTDSNQNENLETLKRKEFKLKMSLKVMVFDSVELCSILQYEFQ